MKTRKRRDIGAAATMLLPSLAVLAVFVLYPLGRAVWMGQQRCSVVTKVCRSSGWGQYLDVLQSTQFQDRRPWTVGEMGQTPREDGLVVAVVLEPKYDPVVFVCRF